MSIVPLQAPYTRPCMEYTAARFFSSVYNKVHYLSVPVSHALLTLQEIVWYGGESPYMTRTSAGYQVIVHNQKPENYFLPRTCIAALKQCQRDRDCPSHLSQQHQFPGLCLKSWVGSSLLTGKILRWKQDLTSVLIPLCVWVPITIIKSTLRGWRWKMDLFFCNILSKDPEL